jgi:hypothetical protein
MWRVVVVVALAASCVTGRAIAASAASPGTCHAALAAYAHDQRSAKLERAAIVRCGSVTTWVRAVRAAFVGSKRTDLATTKGHARDSLDTACIGNDDLTLCTRLASASTTTFPPGSTSSPSLAALCVSAHHAFAEGRAIPAAESESILVGEMAITGTSADAQNLLDSLRGLPPDQQGDYGLVFIVTPLVKTCNGKGL